MPYSCFDILLVLVRACIHNPQKLMLVCDAYVQTSKIWTECCYLLGFRLCTCPYCACTCPVKFEEDHCLSDAIIDMHATWCKYCACVWGNLLRFGTNFSGLPVVTTRTKSSKSAGIGSLTSSPSSKSSSWKTAVGTLGLISSESKSRASAFKT